MNRCYGRVLKLLSECVQLWYDLGFNLYQQSLYSEDENVVGVVEKLVEVFKKGLFLEFVNYQIWNIFGFVYCYSGEILEEINDYIIIFFFYRMRRIRKYVNMQMKDNFMRLIFFYQV